jgi:hypothetical protein
MSEETGPTPDDLDSARDDIIKAYEKYREEVPQHAIDAALSVTAETDNEASEIELLTSMWNAVDAYIGWCHEQTFLPADGTYESAKGIIERLWLIKDSRDAP